MLGGFRCYEGRGDFIFKGQDVLKMRVVEDNWYSLPVFCFYQLVAVKEEDGGRTAVCCWLRGHSHKYKVPSKSRQPFICHKHISGNECSETTLWEPRIGPKHFSTANYSNIVFTTFYHVYEQGVPGLSRGKSCGAWYWPCTPARPRLQTGWSYTSACPLCLHKHVIGWPLPLPDHLHDHPAPIQWVPGNFQG